MSAPAVRTVNSDEEDASVATSASRSTIGSQRSLRSATLNRMEGQFVMLDSLQHCGACFEVPKRGMFVCFGPLPCRRHGHKLLDKGEFGMFYQLCKSTTGKTDGSVESMISPRVYEDQRRIERENVEAAMEAVGASWSEVASGTGGEVKSLTTESPKDSPESSPPEDAKPAAMVTFSTPRAGL